MLCTQCGNDNPASNRFCGECGAKLEAPASIESKSRPVAPLDLRDPTDPGHIIVPANGRNAEHVVADEAVATAAEPPAYETGSRLDEGVAYSGHERVAAEPVEPRQYVDAVEPRHYMAAGGEVTHVEEPARQRDTSIHGPSLLGLSDDEFNSTPRDVAEPADYSYLYDDEGGGGRTVNWRLMLALLILIGFGGVIGYMWYQGKSWNTAIIKGSSDQQNTQAQSGGEQKSATPPEIAKNESTTPGAPEIAVGATQKPIPANTPQSDHVADALKNGAPLTSADGKHDQPKDAGDSGGAAKGEPAAAATTDAPKQAKPADNQPTAKADDSKDAKAKAADDTGDEEDVEPAAPAKTKRAAAVPAKGKKASAARAAAANDESDTEDATAQVHRADALLKARSCTQAVDLLREAALHGNATARARLGGLYATGHCVALDRAEAYNWFTLAKDAGARYSWIEHNRSMLWAQMSESERERVVRR